MRRFIPSLVILCLSAHHASTALAALHLDLLHGHRDARGEGRSQTYAVGQETAAGIHANPIPGVPIGVGGFISRQNLCIHGGKHNRRRIRALTYGPELKIWLPVASVQPYARFARVFGAYKGDHRGDWPGPGGYGPVDGLRVGFGAAWEALPLVSVVGELSIASDRAKLTADANKEQITLARVSDRFGFETTGFLFGIKVGI